MDDKNFLFPPNGKICLKNYQADQDVLKVQKRLKEKNK